LGGAGHQSSHTALRAYAEFAKTTRHHFWRLARTGRCGLRYYDFTRMVEVDVEIKPHALRMLLSELLRSDPDFEAFCLDAYPEIYQRFGRGMQRVEKENLLLLHAPSRSELVSVLRERFPDAAVWHASRVPELQKGTRRVPLVVASMLGAVLLAAFVVRAVLRSIEQGSDVPGRGRAASTGACNALQLDDVFVVKGVGTPPNLPILLDIRLRHDGRNAALVNITRAVVECGEKTPERSPYEPSASYDLLISSEHNEAAIAQRIGPGELDRMLIRIGFTREAAGYEYSAKLKLVYNGRCEVESPPFLLSRDAARYVGFSP